MKLKIYDQQCLDIIDLIETNWGYPDFNLEFDEQTGEFALVRDSESNQSLVVGVTDPEFWDIERCPSRERIREFIKELEEIDITTCIYISSEQEDWDWNNEYYLLDRETVEYTINSTTREYEIEYGITIIPKRSNDIPNEYKRDGNIFNNTTLITEEQLNTINQALNTAFFELFNILKERQKEVESE